MARKELKTFLKDNKFDVTKAIVDDYSISLKNYLASINVAIQANESEEHLKGILIKFLKDTLYADGKYTINTKGTIDAAISKDNKLQVIMEVKKPTNINEMITETNLNRKALWEIILYYIENTRNIKEGKAKRNPDSEIKNIVITDCKKFFVFDSQKIEAIVQGELVKFWEQKENDQLISKNKDIFYDKEKEFFAIEENLSKLDFVYFDIEELSENQTGLTSTYKMLSRQILLKDNAKRMVASPLNAAFYQELLYILGLKEETEKGKPIIKINFEIENTFAVQVYKYLKDDKGILDENEVIDKTFSAIIVWTNRLLFIKLFEGQLFAINGEKQEYRILDNDKIRDENDLQKLFFKVLGTKNRESEEFFDQFKNIPYLNSSLFENYDVEKNDIMIRDIDNKEIEIKPHSKTGRKGKVKLIEYVIDFLNSYSFSSVLVEEGEVAGGKDIIDAATLGLIFEKINGYKDGSFYTPSSITEYICKEAIELSVIQKINEAYKQNIDTFDDLKFFVSSKGNFQEKKKINEIINNLKICDPAVGSGHFLVSALNRIIAIKSELGVLFYNNENRLLNEYEIRVIDDILTITDGNGEPFVYNRGDVGSLKVQKTIFCEKRQIIENCLFGVDINDKAVAICQLRLWIELLKNAYYENNIMETLPNIDINIKCGNSLVHKLPVEVGKKLSEKNDKDLKDAIKEYRQRVNEYKKENDKVSKQEIKSAISKVKRQLHQVGVQTSMDFMDDTTDFAELELMKNAFEWAIEFPEVLSDDGTFLGFDCVIGNPPYISTKESDAEQKIILKKVFGFVDDFYYHFIVKGFDLLKNYGCIAIITPDTYFTTLSKQALRQKLLENKLKVIAHLGQDIFDSAMVSTAICVAVKSKAKDEDRVTILDAKGFKNILLAPMYRINQTVYRKSINQSIFVPNAANILINHKFASIHNDLICKYWDLIFTSKGIEKNLDSLIAFRRSLKTGEITLLGLLTNGGVGLQTANNGKFIGVRKETKEAQRTMLTRIEKLVEFNNRTKNNYAMPEDEFEVRRLFDALKEKYGRDIFGQGYLYRIVDNSEMADLHNITDAERENGIVGFRTFVPYDKGDKDGNRWYLETPYVIDWSRENVNFLKSFAGKKEIGSPRFQNRQFYFKEGFCYSDIKTFYLRCRLKGNSIHDVKSMSFFPLDERTPAYYLISIINSKLIALIVYNFLNNTPSFQINDCRMLPIIIPTDKQLSDIKILFDKAVGIKQRQFSGEITLKQAEKELIPIQNEVDLFVYKLYGFTTEEIAIMESTEK